VKIGFIKSDIHHDNFIEKFHAIHE
jgi:hypothetical protein